MTNRRKIVGGVLLLASLAVVVVPSALSASTDNPIWKVAGANLPVGSTEPVELAASGSQTLTSAKLTINCKKVAAAGFKLVGAALPGPGTVTGALEYGECAVAGANEATCKINGAAIGKGTIKTEPLAAREAYLTKSAAESEALGTEETVTAITAASGELFAEFALSGTCPVSGAVKVEGTGLVLRNIGANEEVEGHEIEAPTTAITKYFSNPGAGEVKGLKLELGGGAATYSGKVLAKLTSKSQWNLAK